MLPGRGLPSIRPRAAQPRADPTAAPPPAPLIALALMLSMIDGELYPLGGVKVGIDLAGSAV